MDELVKALERAGYLLTPSAYYLLVDHFKEGKFSLVELVKFAKSKGVFIIDGDLAYEFLQFLGLGVPQEIKESYISTGEEAEKTVESQETRASELEEGGVSQVSSGELQELKEESPEISTTEEEIGGLELVQSSISTGSEVEYNNGENGESVVVLDKYGYPILYAPEEIGEEKEYSKYEDVVIEWNPSVTPVQIEKNYEVKFDVRQVKLRPPKVKNGSGKEGEIIVEAYASLFKSRLSKLKRILRENPEISNVVDIGKLNYVSGDEEVTIIGLVNSKRETNRGLIFEVEDKTGIVKVFLPKDSEDYREAFKVLPDAVVAFKGFYSKKGIFFANKFYLPDVPLYRKQKPPLEEKVYAILISDIHVGSREFCEKAFLKFLEWLNGHVESKEEEEIVSRVKYLIIAGDVVDGIGIYPGQYSDLVIPDIFDQYEALANLLANVPEHITMFIGPGNHDAARPAIPQPEFYKEYAKPIYKLKNAIIISNPAVIRLHGRDFLIAHGRGIEDVVSFVPGLTHHKPGLPMVELLKMRHLAPTFGGKVPIAPDPEDLLVIEEVPDLVQMGHVHVYDAVVYRGVQLVNSATWQAQTEFQKMVNIVPTPAKVPVVDVESARVVKVLDFSGWC
ncbi:DNA-directed DNA polymerase II small subunit [Pyrococcus abyssi]|uniref:DNA polymerase II small subunit n=2 Tax=Pyrococcus abyssi (strain GE5 / Orsay) TaxID=272844 RepID=DP2S_PYRAB|nr:DNA-directed DNA polymerase II small subunit [Pyrococcus abyssi]Q9V2F3.1 RecName: Full=DNA polymerase II small subunit; Short=Pol II; AltName: Full=Exodeoxyribonuclease small subunit [Pyrococcus abyssi GE5]CAB49045.1 dp1/polB intein containing DNA polymerase II small subunit (2.7.7.7) [Pyrococcus abyssi GE5]CCE69497.1 TPA: DNA polymerase II small subunit [Pyrococcus abyssi GE5]